MANLEIIGEKLQCYIYIYINNKVYCIDKDNCTLNLELDNGKYDMTIIGTKTKDYNLDETLKSMSLKIKPVLFQRYKQKDILNHILGWDNNTYFFIKKIVIGIKSKSRINLSVNDYFFFNYFETKQIIKDVEIKTNAHIYATKKFNFISKKQKIKYYATQFILLLLKYGLNIIYIINMIFNDICYIIDPDSVGIIYSGTASKYDIIIDSIFFIIFLVRLAIYSAKIVGILRNNSDVMKGDWL